MKTTPDDYRVRYCGPSTVQLPDGDVITADRWSTLSAVWSVKDGASDPFLGIVRGLPAGTNGRIGLPLKEQREGTWDRGNFFVVCGVSARAIGPTTEAWFTTDDVNVDLALHSNRLVYREVSLAELLIEGGVAVTPRTIPERIPFGVFVSPDLDRLPKEGQIVIMLWGFGVAGGSGVERDRYDELAKICHPKDLA